MIDFTKVTIGQFIGHCQLVQQLQPMLDEQFNGQPATVMDLFIRCPSYVEAVVRYWTGWATVKDRDMDLVLGIFASIEKLSTLPEPTAINRFELDGIAYQAPSDLHLPNQAVPMGKATFGQVLEALQIEQLMGGNYDMVPYVLAMVFLKDGETVDDVEIAERASVLKQLPMDTALNAYFFLANCASTWLKRINRYLEAQPMLAQTKLV